MDAMPFAQSRKRRAEDESDSAASSSPKPAKQSLRTAEEDLEWVLTADIGDLERYLNIPLPDELQEITQDLQSGSHVLLLEHNSARNAKCRAFKCLVQTHGVWYDEKIQSPYRINLQAKTPDNRHWSMLDKPNRRFYHVSCIEATGVDLAKYLKRPPEALVSPLLAGYSVQYNDYHPAIADWVANEGKAFNAELYDSEEFRKAREVYEQDRDHRIMTHMFRPAPDDDPSDPVKEPPRSTDFLPGEPTKRKLTDVLLDTMGIGRFIQSLGEDRHLKSRIKLLEVLGAAPKRLLDKSRTASDDGADAEKGSSNGVDGGQECHESGNAKDRTAISRKADAEEPSANLERTDTANAYSSAAAETGTSKEACPVAPDSETNDLEGAWFRNTLASVLICSR